MLQNSLKNINAFLNLIKNQQPLFLNENRHEDLKEASANFREKDDELADDIIAWCDKYTDIKQALRQTRKKLYSGETQSTGDRIPGTTKPIAPPPPPPDKVSRETLLNAIQESFPNQSK
jgi:hypothetical protein